MFAGRLILDARGSTDLDQAKDVRREGDPPVGDPNIDDTYDALGHVYDYFRAVHFRDSLDGAGGPLVAVVNFGTGSPNAWLAEGILVFGDGGDLFPRFTSSPTVIYQLAAQGFLEEARISTRGGDAQSLGLASASVFACLVDQFVRRVPASSASWLVGEGINRPWPDESEFESDAMHSLASPGSMYADPQVSHMDEFSYQTDGGARNAGIPAHAFYRFAIDLGGYAWERAGQVWYEAWTHRKVRRPLLTFRKFARLTSKITADSYGPQVGTAALDAWRAVGLDIRV